MYENKDKFSINTFIQFFVESWAVKRYLYLPYTTMKANFFPPHSLESIIQWVKKEKNIYSYK